MKRLLMVEPLMSAIRSLGFTNGLLYLLGRAMQALSGGRWRLIRYYLVAQPVPSPFIPVCRSSESERVLEITLPNPIIEKFPRPYSVIQGRFKKKYVCLAACSKQRFSGFLWFARGSYDEDEVHCRFVLAAPISTVWDFDVHVEPDFRLGRTFARLWDAANERFSSDGIEWSISRISAFNKQSIQSHGRMGILRLHVLTFVCLGKLQIGLMSCRPYFNICWNGLNSPTVVLEPPRLK
jgi:hypothetical protein